MKKEYSSIGSLLLLLSVLGIVFAAMKPQSHEDGGKSLSEFSTKRAFAHIEAMTQKPHYVGSLNHDVVANYVVQELQKLGLETTTQVGFTLSDGGNLVQSKNVLARIKGTDSAKKALLLLSHYDSAPHSYSHGASDDASGVATILESVRAFLHSKKAHQNDVIILFTDAEELGLNGAALFVTQHAWAKQVGLVLNFEARGSSGPSYMLMETNAGNAGLVKEFAAANATYPVSNSLMYSIYKMLPNDTDLTVFRQQGNIQGYNFAFIDDHFNYHTAQDDAQHLDQNTLAHQGTYLMPLLNYFSNANLAATKATVDYAYFTIPFAFISYPFSWIWPMAIVALAIFIFLVFLGKAKRIITFREVGRGFFPFVGSLLVAGLVTYFGWKGLLLVYPQYGDLLNGFTYNGHAYIAAFVLLSLAICFLFYSLFSFKKVTMNHYVLPLLIWISINFLVAVYLPGAGFLIIPVFFGLFAFGAFVLTQKSNWIFNVLCGIPTLLIVAPFIQMFPVGLGLKVLFGSAILTVLAFGLLLPIFGAYAKKGILALLFFGAAVGFFAKAHLASGYESGKAKSNSLLYVYNADTDKANWVTYDTNLDSWTKTYLGEVPKKVQKTDDLPLFSKYNSVFTYTAQAPKINVQQPTIAFLRDSVVGNVRYLKIKITPNRAVNRYDIFANEKMDLHLFKANGATVIGQKDTQLVRKGKKILSYYVVNNEPLELQFRINSSTVFDMDLMESSFDLVTNPLLNLKKRESWMMPTPFVLNDAVVIRKKIKPTPVVAAPLVIPAVLQPIAKDSLK
ncbi:M28 family peptidase [Flavobacterium restrictum]|uniref:Vacuolar membrane protease n=1 Tax=Flavobacterium restrictum TaxID=2594428 RepID=A0A553DVL1_9FLAO|nr:M20/M25/M40 family metallo-hydrolase [Flavobacterium restrictum]TRX36710.1 M20/M25/M40 family metallo-hydrolase [Flavobacterium restrictum]